jgi:glycosyltransferase involved in cell wall biosynthesis
MKICYFSDFDLAGSGYLNLSMPLCRGLRKRNHEVKVVGLGYRGQEHYEDFAILPTNNIQEGLAILQNLYNLWGFDALVVALDVPLQEALVSTMQNRPFGYVGIMPIEADPLCMSWAMALMRMDKALIISKFGTEEANKLGVNAEYIPIGIDVAEWRFALPQEREKARQAMGFEPDEKIILTVADNQERKNLVAGMDIFSKFIKKYPKSKYCLVTREHNFVGWRLRDYAQEIGINDKFMIYERGIPFSDLWLLYIACDAFMLTSKTEGLGLPLLEAMAVGLPCVATNATGMRELLSDERGRLVGVKFVHRDPFGNGKRYWIDIKDGADKLISVFEDKDRTALCIGNAASFAQQSTWDKAIDKLEDTLLAIGKNNEKETHKKA